MKFDQIRIGHIGLTEAGREFHVKAIDESDETVMDEFGTWLYFYDCHFPSYEY